MSVFLNYQWFVAFMHMVLAIILFFIVNWLGAKSVSMGYMQMKIVIEEECAPAFNFLFKVIAPVVFMLLCAVTFEALGLKVFNKNIYFITVFYWLFRVLWIICTSRASLTNWGVQFFYWVTSIGLSIWIYSLLESVEQILPSPRSLLDQLWILIIMFLYSVLNNLQIGRKGTVKRKNNYIQTRYLRFKRKYDSFIKDILHNDFYEALTYSIMIYEDFNRPIVIRWIEYLRFFITKKPHTLGIMQIMTNTYINNEDSIRLAIYKIIQDSKGLMKQYSDSPSPDLSYMAYLIADKYNPGDYKYAGEIRSVFEYISTCFYGKLPNSYDEIAKIITYEQVEEI